LAVIDFADALPGDLQIQAIVQGQDGGSGFWKNSQIVFDFVDNDNFKFAGAFYGAGDWRIGRVTGGTIVYEQQTVDTLSLGVDYSLTVNLNGTMATLTADGIQKASFDFGETLTDGQVGVGTFNAQSQFDNLTVAVPEPSSIVLITLALIGLLTHDRRRRA
jgi:hypothetical protein